MALDVFKMLGIDKEEIIETLSKFAKQAEVATARLNAIEASQLRQEEISRRIAAALEALKSGDTHD